MPVDCHNISLPFLQKAINFWEAQGFSLCSVPLLVDSDIMDHTCPSKVRDNRITHINGKQFVASAEQSFLQLDKENSLPVGRGKLMALTPCYRDEEVLDNTHLNIFLKLELFWYGSEANPTILSHKMTEFLSSIGIDSFVLKTQDGYDVMCGDLELGSYGERKTTTGRWYVYGTGLAEPRTSLAFQTSNTGCSIATNRKII